MIGNVPSLAPVGIPKGVDPRTWRQAIERRLNDLLDQSMALITALDLMEADCDLEDGGDDEHALGWTERGPSAFGENTDRERDDSDDEPACEDEGAQCDDEGVIDSGIADLDALGILGLR
jgi:hypothetical protein